MFFQVEKAAPKGEKAPPGEAAPKEEKAAPKEKAAPEEKAPAGGLAPKAAEEGQEETDQESHFDKALKALKDMRKIETDEAAGSASETECDRTSWQWRCGILRPRIEIRARDTLLDSSNAH